MIDHAPTDDPLDVALGYYLLAVEAGQSAPAVQDELLGRFPDRADELRDFFRAQGSLDDSLRPRTARMPADDPALETWTYPGGRMDDPDAPPPTFGPYELIEEIARGGMGVVYKARHTELHRVVALKMILTGQLATPDEVERFRAEAEAAATLEHPNIVPIYEIGEFQGRHYFTMKLIEGGNLKSHLPRLRADLKAAARLLAAVARAVHFAHQRRLLHRDLKPANVLIDEHGEPLITDFGLAKHLGEGATLHTKSGDIMGTPSYMAPEQARAAKSLTTAVDVYGLGAILYEVLAGRPPFHSESAWETLMNVMETEPPPPRSFNPAVDRDLQTICLKCLEKPPEGRYGSAEALADDLGRWLSGKPIRARPVGQAERLWKWVKRHRGPALLATVVAACLLVGFFALAVEWRRADAARQALAESLYFNGIALAERELAAGNGRRAAELLADCPDQLRGWEWHHLERRLVEPPPTVAIHSDRIYGLAYSPDGWRLATAGRDGTVVVWDMLEGRPDRTIRPHGVHEVTCVAYSPDGRWLASAGGDGRVALPPSGPTEPAAAPGELVGHAGTIMGLAYSPDGRTLATASRDGTVRAWSVEARAELWRSTSHGQWVHAVAFSPDGRLVASAGHDGTVRLHDAKTGSETVAPLHGHTDAARAVAFSPDGTVLASGSYDGTVRLWSVVSGANLAVLAGHTGHVWSLAFTPDGTRLASVSLDETVKLWDVPRRREALTLRGHNCGVWGVAFHPDGQTLASGDAAGRVRFWSAAPLPARADPAPVFALAGHSGPAFDAAYSADGRVIATACGDGAVRVWSAADGHLARKLPDVLPQAGSLAFVGRDLAVAARAGHAAEIRDLDTLALRLRFLGHTQDVVSVSASADGRLLATAGQDSWVRVWDALTGAELQKFRSHGGYFYSVAFGPGDRVAAGHGDREAVVWDARTGRELLHLTGHTEPVVGVAFSPDGRFIATAGWDKRVIVRDAATGAPLHTLAGHTSLVYRLAFSPDGGTLASASWDRTVRLWSAERGELIRVLTGHTAPVYAVSFSPDGRHLVTAGGELGRGEAFVWER